MAFGKDEDVPAGIDDAWSGAVEVFCRCAR
jgi:hypothetical protein